MPPDRTALDDPSLLTPETVAQALGSDLTQGLSADEAARRRAQDGPNTLRSSTRTSLWQRALAQGTDPLVLLLLAAAAIATGVWALEGRHGWPVDAAVIGLVVVLNAVLGLLQEAKADHAVAALARMTAVTSSVLRGGQLQRIPSADLVRGDLLVLAEGDAVGADARLVEATALHVQEASLTGESAAVLKDTATLPDAVSLGDRLCMVYKGTAAVQGSGRALVTATGMDSEMGAIATLLDATTAAPTPLQKEVARIGRALGLAAVVIAVGVVGTVLAMSDTHTPADLVRVLLLGVSLAVAAVPEGLPAILSVVLAMGVQRMAGRQAIVKTLAAVETLGSASVIASDKTGTLTRAEMTIVRVMTASGGTHVTGVGYVPDGRVEHQGAELAAGPLRDEHIAVLSGGSLASNADLRQTADGAWEIQGDPTEAAFLVAERKLGVHTRRTTRFARIAELPFTSDRKMMSTVALDHDHGDLRVLITKGAPDVLLGRCTQARVGLETVALDDDGRRHILADVGTLSDAALRTLAVAYRPLRSDEDMAAAPETLERDLVFVGTVGIIDPPRPEAAVAIREAHSAGIRVIMITGDHPGTALRIAADLGIVEAGAPVLTGADLDALDEPGLADAVRRTSVYARVAPRHKLRIVAALQADGNVVAMTGDGVNDAPALKAADIGIAMGRTGTEVTKDAARMILADDNFATIVHAVREGRGVLDNIRKFLRYLLSSNLGEVLTVFLGLVGAGVLGLKGDGGAVALPLLATQILWINLITDAGPALAMGVDPMTEDVMARPPRKSTERVIDGRLWAGVVEIGVVMALLTLFTLDLYLPGGWIEGTQSLDQARTAAFTVLVLAQLFNAFNARSEHISALRGLFANRWLWGAVVLSALLQVAVVQIGVLNLAFGTRPMPAAQWGMCIAIASGVLWFSELRKGIRRAMAHRRPRPDSVQIGT
ncbi:cation-translocating P-type ATPase [Sphaerotilus sp.]|uniref:cation-translocating P-type ATPase n=1 Tax=Sphaerotilus sp. TaxID=2093942 RepID=UPI00286DE8E4|nr:cation-translocating P-type ATPase [Sphaerotilus sp.]